MGEIKNLKNELFVSECNSVLYLLHQNAIKGQFKLTLFSKAIVQQ